ncbi:protein DWARF 53-LIKE-like [Canna indica]|uniref:Protein DWARF 53-LIKE-like n=1 Tax=Canna indica TaxID=4628 RepID=A0AAQ3JV34_9LILI|nr:protein DWARF 53-LIKE-like [Canna indica]
MPTPVSNARACLAAEAAAALDDAVAVARRRAHAQTTSLHVVYALLLSSSSSPSPSSPAAAGRAAGGGSSASCSILRDALSRARSSAYSPRLQFKALELCFGVALDRLPSSTANRQAAEGGAAGDEPPVSNSLMAAIKRSQANQRRNPDTFHLYQQQQQQSTAAGGVSSFSGVKVELQQLVLAILDDPVVSRVFGDAGFRSTDIKLAILRPPPPILRFPRAARCPPLFLCNFSAGDGFDAALTPRGLVFPFAAAAGQLCSDGSDENCRRLGEIVCRKNSGRNPMLVGVGAGEAARDFSRAIERQNWTVLPPELRGIKFLSIEKEIAEFSSGGGQQLAIGTLLEELGKKAESSGVVLSIGDLKGMVEGSADCDEQESCLVSELTRMLEVYHGRLWVMGWSATYETYMKFLSKHPMLDKDWDLQLLPITSVRTAMSGTLPRSPSLMESFVPFGGFFPTAFESKNLLSNVYPSVLRYEQCNDKFEQEVAVTVKDHSASVDDQQNENFPFWLRKASTVSLNDGHDTLKAKDDKTVSNAEIVDLNKKCNENSQHLGHDCQTTNTDHSSAVPCCGSQSCISNMERAGNQNKQNPADSQNHSGFEISIPVSVGARKTTMGSKSMSLPSLSDLGNKDLLSKLQVRLSKSEPFRRDGFQFYQGDGHASPSSVTSVLTDLVLGTPHEPSCNEESPTLPLQNDHPDELSVHLPPMKLLDMAKGIDPDVPVESFSCSGHQDLQANSTHHLVLTRSFSQISNTRASAYDKPSLISSSTWQKFDLGDYKSFCSTLTNKVGRQEEAATAISEAILHCKNGERRRGSILRGDIWLNFCGPDKIGKKRMAVALAEMIYGSKENFICIDLSDHDSIARPSTISAQLEVNVNDVQFRGKMTVDHIAQDLRKKPQSILFLQNVNKADCLVQSSLLQAMRTGKFPDSHGREFSTNNSIFILASSSSHGLTFPEMKDYSSFSEETILAACCWQMKILAEPSREALSSPKANKVSFSSSPNSRSNQAYLHSVFVSKRKLDLSNDYMTQHETLMTAKRANKTAKVFLDLNLPVEEVETNDNYSTCPEDCSTSESSEAWMEEFFDLADAIVDFKPFDFDALADTVVQDISKIFHGALGSDCSLEIDPKVMEEILAVAWSLEERGALNNWFEEVLYRSFMEARYRYNLSNCMSLRLVACENALAEMHAPGILLPSRIILS